MKLNSYLFLILATLLGVGYFLDRDDIQSHQKQSLEKKILDSAQISKLSLPHLNLSLKESRWRSDSGALLERSRVELLINYLKGISILSIINDKSGKKESYFSERKYEIKVDQAGSKLITIGDISKVSGNFYVKVGNLIYIAYLDTEFKQPYRSEFEKKVSQYISFIDYLNGSETFYIETNLLIQLGVNKLQKIKIDNTRNISFEVDMNSNNTSPKAYRGIQYKSATNVLEKALHSTRVMSKLSLTQKILTQKRSIIHAYMNSTVKEFTLYDELNGEAGSFVLDSQNGDVFKLEEGMHSLFFLNRQDFWLKKQVFKNDLSQLSSLQFSLSTNGSEFTKFSIKDLKTFEISPSDKKIQFKKNKMNFLFNVLLNLLSFKEASYVEEVLTFSPAGDGLWVSLMDRNFYIITKKGLVELIDLDNMVKFVYLYDSSLLGEDILGDIFTRKEK